MPLLPPAPLLERLATKSWMGWRSGGPGSPVGTRLGGPSIPWPPFREAFGSPGRQIFSTRRLSLLWCRAWWYGAGCGEWGRAGVVSLWWPPFTRRTFWLELGRTGGDPSFPDSSGPPTTVWLQAGRSRKWLRGFAPGAGWRPCRMEWTRSSFGGWSRAFRPGGELGSWSPADSFPRMGWST